jgi:Raf kinase inhibitor-like YbhB/YbcL family protein
MRILPIAAALTTLACAGPALPLTLTSRDLTPGAQMPTAHIYPRCGGQNLSPEVAWSGAPVATRSFVLTMIDMDVKPALWSHWVVVDLPASAISLPRGVKALPAGAHAVASNFGEGYNGPCPPPGSGVHHYRLTVWAMPGARFAAKPDQPADDLMAKLSAATLAHASLTTTVAAKP